MLKTIPLSFLILIFAACSTLDTSQSQNQASGQHLMTQAESWAMLQGRWYGHIELEAGAYREWLVERKANGFYQIHFRSVDANGAVKDRIEAGEWGVVGSIYFSIYKADIIAGGYYPVSLSEPSYRDGYQIIVLNDSEFRYRSLNEAIDYKVKRVDQHFKLAELKAVD